MTKDNTKEIQEIEQGLNQLKRQLNRDRLTNLVPMELFTDYNGNVDLKAHTQEVEKVLNEGYDSNPDNDRKVIEVYSKVLKEIDRMRASDRQQQNQKDISQKVETLHDQGLGHNDLYRDGMSYQIFRNPRDKPPLLTLT